MRILGIDPGIARTGWGVIDSLHGKVSVVEYGCIETEKNLLLPERLKLLHTILLEIIHTYSPDVMAVEELFFNTNVKTALIVGQARGVALLSAAENNLLLSTYTPLQVKMALTGYGRAEKTQVGQMVKTILRLQTVPKPDDTADALAIAVTHSFSAKVEAKIAKF